MTYVKRLVALPYYQSLLHQLEEKEKDRIYCKHDFTHFLDVARITAILVRDFDIDVSDEAIYLTALLHDIGRLDDGMMPHAQASIRYAKECLERIHYPADKHTLILDVIANHRYRGRQKPKTFIEAFSLADNLSRACYRCPATESCKWSDERKNHFPVL